MEAMTERLDLLIRCPPPHINQYGARGDCVGKVSEASKRDRAIGRYFFRHHFLPDDDAATGDGSSAMTCIVTHLAGILHLGAPSVCQHEFAGGTLCEGVSQMREPSEEIARRVRAEVAFEERLKTEAVKMATALIQGYIGPDHKVLSMSNFHSALAQALRQAREQGQLDRSRQALRL